jgi:hypothetical protein
MWHPKRIDQAVGGSGLVCFSVCSPLSLLLPYQPSDNQAEVATRQTRLSVRIAVRSIGVAPNRAIHVLIRCRCTVAPANKSLNLRSRFRGGFVESNGG